MTARNLGFYECQNVLPCAPSGSWGMVGRTLTVLKKRTADSGALLAIRASGVRARWLTATTEPMTGLFDDRPCILSAARFARTSGLCVPKDRAAQNALIQLPVRSMLAVCEKNY